MIFSNKRVGLTTALGAALIAGGCASKSPQPLPEWVDNPPSSTSATIYGVGEGVNREHAERLGLESIAGQISTEVSSESVFQARETNAGFERDARNRVETRVEDLSLSHFETQQIHRDDERIYALVELDRQSFTADLEEEARDLQSSLEDTLSDETVSDLRLLSRFASSQEDIARLERKSQILISFNSDEGRSMREVVRNFNTQRDHLLSSLQISVVYDDDTSQRIARSLRDAFVQFGISASVTDSNSGNSNRVVIDSDSRINESFDSYMATIHAEIAVVDDANHELSRIQRGYNASSLSSPDNAMQSAVRKLESAVSRDGIFAYLDS